MSYYVKYGIAQNSDGIKRWLIDALYVDVGKENFDKFVTMNVYRGIKDIWRSKILTY